MESQFKDLYKYLNPKEERQEIRRQTLLHEQKQQRSKVQDEGRKLEDVFTKLQKNSPKHRRRTYKQKYDQNHSLQLSEWLQEQPVNLNQWYLVPCPKGQRCLVIACNGITEMYNKVGKLMFSFHSSLPGDRESRHEITILDCIYVQKIAKFYILDALSLGNQDLLHCETQFRFYWIKTRFEENPICESVNDYNDYTFSPLKFYDFDNTENIQECLYLYPQWENNCPELDGFFFYHKEASYTCGTTPLVGWLFAFMIPELLNFDVNPLYLLEKPDNYTNYLNYMIKFDENRLKKLNHRRIKNKDKMEEEIIEQNDDVLTERLESEP